MDFKFIVLALVTSAVAGEESILKKLASPVAFTNKSLSLDTINHSDVAYPSHEKVAPERFSSMIPNFKPISLDKAALGTDTNLTTTEKIITTDLSTTTNTTSPPNPTTPPVPEEGQWKVQNATGGVCILVQMELKFNVTYPGIDGRVKNDTIFVPKNSTAHGSCSDSSQSIQLTWDNGNYFKIVFGLNKTSNKFEIRLLNLTVNVTSFKDVDANTNFTTYLSNKVEFPAVPVKMSYKCDKEQIQLLNSTTDKYSAKMFVSHAQLEAFMSKKDAAFSEAEDCEGFETPDIVPIAVGCVLSILVVIVLVAYLIGRRRAVNRGYLSILGTVEGDPRDAISLDQQEYLKQCQCTEERQRGTGVISVIVKTVEEGAQTHCGLMCAKFEIVSARTIDAKDGHKKHVAYTILVRKDHNDNDPIPAVIERRYTDFLELYKTLGQDYPALTSQIYFPRKVLLGNFTSDLIKLRSHSFENFLRVIASNEKLRESPRLKWFLTGHEEKKARKWLETKCYGQAKPLLENIFRLLSKIHTDRHPSVMIALCRLTACCNEDPKSLIDAEKYAELALRRFEGVSDIDLLCFYVPLLQLCIHLWWALGRDKEALESRLISLKRHGHRVEGCTPLLESMLNLD